MPALALAMFVWAPIPSDAKGGSEAWQLFILYANQLAIWVLVFFVLQFFHRFFAESSPARAWLADAALSMYLVHHSLVYVFGRLFVGVDWHPVAEFALVTLLAASAVLAFHELGIRRVPLLRFLFNGKTDLGRAGVPAPRAMPAE
jgi:peptidoglycan/LPS O-acetylase OafA/YrhL